MPRFIHRAIKPMGFSSKRAAILAVASAAVAIALVVPAVASAAAQTLTVSKGGSGSGTVSSSPFGIECGGTCSASFSQGSTVTLIASSGFHTETVKWAGCDNVIADVKCLVAMDAARTVFATFELERQYVEYTVSARRKGTGAGSVVSFPDGIECGEDCSESYLFKTLLTLVAIPATGSEFVHWSGGACTGSAPCERKINSTRTVYAVFRAIGNRTLTVAKAGTGQGTVVSKPAGIECGSTCSAQLDASTKVVLSAAPAAGSTFTGWSGEGCSGTKACRVRMNEARNVSATFIKQSSPPAQCRVPRLAGKTLDRARSALSAAHCSLGKLRKPRGSKLAKLRVRSSSPSAGSVLAAGAKVDLRLARLRTKR